MGSLFISIIKNKSSNNYNIYNGFYKKSNHLKIITTPTNNNIYNISNNNNNLIDNRYYTSKIKKKVKFSSNIHKVNNSNISLAGNLVVKDVFSNLKPFVPLSNDDVVSDNENDNSNSEINNNINSVNNSNNSLTNIDNNLNNSLIDINNISINNNNNYNLINNSSLINNNNNNNNNSVSINNNNNNNNNLINNNNQDLSNQIIEKIKINLNENSNNKEEFKNEEIYLNPKQYFAYRPLTVVRVRDSEQRNELIQQLRVAMPQSSWKVSKNQPNLVIGNVNPEVYREFIKNHTRFNQYNHIEVTDDSKQPFVGFSKQILPNSIAIDEKSIQGWVEKACEFISSNYRSCKWRRWRIHLITPTSHLAQNNERSQIESLIIKHLKKKHHKDLSNSYTLRASSNRALELLSDEALVQIMFVGANDGYISVMTPTIYQYFKKMISIYPSGKAKPLLGTLNQYIYRLFSPQLSSSHIHVQTIKNYMNPSQSLDQEIIKSMSFDNIISTFLPSRSFVKLVELFIRFPKFPSMKKNDTVCDLGSSPGGWTLFSLLQGCCVVSIDKAPLDHRFIDLENDEDHLIHIRDDAFSFDPIGRFDWLIIDMKVPPIKTLKLLEKWLLNNNCSNFIINLKFDKSSQDVIQCEKFIHSNLLPLTSYINSHCLDSNGDKEITLFGIKK